ncbi:chemotaxis protein MotB [Hydrogenispora ethanolica]|uniref:Chemotaxis protein MotB n=1 Tax=Hydrogenispora ethanolica TaxID=1082276 RepID=A0A4R1SB79_HYDET|nr:flagellar motor protein MotB [Hydrogenispora ethanolica]TCL76793.1 chemotaxis protein MotB [Hydrogenispora ethanolica]
MSKRKRSSAEEESPEGAPEWMTTYSDLVTLLLTFFILLFSMAAIDQQKFIQIANALRNTFVGAGESFDTHTGRDLLALITQNQSLPRQSFQKRPIPIDKALLKIKESIKAQQLEGSIKVIEEKNAITLRVDSVIFFDSGSAEIKDSAKEILNKLGLFLKELDRETLIQGHTDNRPIKTVQFPSNWELSTKRATNIVVYLIEQCQLDPRRLTPAGNSEFKPIAPNDTEAHRAKNRRIDIVVLKE